jgi:hypothetical protein
MTIKLTNTSIGQQQKIERNLPLTMLHLHRRVS